MQERLQSISSLPQSEQSGSGARVRCALWLIAGFVAASAAAGALSQVLAGAPGVVLALVIAAVAAWAARASWQRSTQALDVVAAAVPAGNTAAPRFVQPIAPLSNG